MRLKDELQDDRAAVKIDGGDAMLMAGAKPIGAVLTLKAFC